MGVPHGATLPSLFSLHEHFDEERDGGGKCTCEGIWEKNGKKNKLEDLKSMYNFSW